MSRAGDDELEELEAADERELMLSGRVLGGIVSMPRPCLRFELLSKPRWAFWIGFGV